MNQKITFFLTIGIVFISSNLFGNNDPVLVTTIEDNKPIEVSMDLELNGAIKLFSILKEEVELINVETEILPSENTITLNNLVLHPDKDFYIGFGSKVEVVTPGNYKKLVKKYFTAAPELVHRVGKRGFRYKNLPSMILYYNKTVAKEESLTKEEMVANDLSYKFGTL